MAVYLVIYDLDAPGKDYTRLINELTRLGAVRVQKSSWLVELSQDIVTFRDAIRGDMDSNDRLFIVEIQPGKSWAGYNMMPPSGDWLLRRRP